MYKAIVNSYIGELTSEYELCHRILKQLDPKDEEAIQMINQASIISMCIKYESFTSDLMSALHKRQMEYNRPWAYTRMIAKKFNLDIAAEYENAHDAWEYYNNLKHVNHRTRLENLKFVREHNIHSPAEALRFTYIALMALLNKIAQIWA